MRFKTLKHKALPNTYGAVELFKNEYYPNGERHEICHSSIPTLQPITATMQEIINYWKKRKDEDELLKQLSDYELVMVDIKIII